MLRSAERYVATLHPNASAPVTRLASEDLFSAVPRSSAVKLPPLQNRRPVFNVKAAKGFNPDEAAIGERASVGLKKIYVLKECLRAREPAAIVSSEAINGGATMRPSHISRQPAFQPR